MAVVFMFFTYMFTIVVSTDKSFDLLDKLSDRETRYKYSKNKSYQSNVVCHIRITPFLKRASHNPPY